MEETEYLKVPKYITVTQEVLYSLLTLVNLYYLGFKILKLEQMNFHLWMFVLL